MPSGRRGKLRLEAAIRLMKRGSQTNQTKQNKTPRKVDLCKVLFLFLLLFSGRKFYRNVLNLLKSCLEASEAEFVWCLKTVLCVDLCFQITGFGFFQY